MDCSVIVCTRNRAAQLSEALLSFTRLVLPAGTTWEVVVVDNGSTDSTADVVRSFEASLPIRRVFQPIPGLSNARNAGVEAAHGDYIVWTDDDVLVAPGWLAAFLTAFRQHPDAAVFGGKVTPVLEGPTPPWFAAAAPHLTDLLATRDFGPRPVPLGIDGGFVGACFAVRAREQRQYAYDPELGVAPGRRRGGEEIDVVNKILAAGNSGWSVPDAEVRHVIPASRQTFAYIVEYYESAGESQAYSIQKSGSKRRMIQALCDAALGLPVRFFQYHLMRALGMKSWAKYFTYYSNKRGVLKYWLASLRGKEKKAAAPASIGMAATSGIAWTMVQTFFGKASLFIGQLILARILTPEDFGILGLAYTVTTFFGILSDMGISQTLQQRHPRTHLWATQAFWISLAFSTFTAIAMAIYAPIGAKLYHNHKIIYLVWILALNMPIAALITVPQARLQSQLRFNFMASYGSVDVIATQILTIFLAWQGFGAMSFVLPIPVMSLIRIIVYWSVAPVALRPLRLARGWGRMIKRSSGIFGSALLSTAIGQGDYITLGLLAPTQVVGIFYFAFKLSAQPMIMMTQTFTNVLRPALVALKSDRLRQRDAAVRTSELLGLLIVPLCFLQIAIAKPGLILLFGSRWVDSIPLIQILSIGLPFNSISWSASTLLAARGQNARMFRYQLVGAPFFFILVGAGALIASSLGVAIGEAIYYTAYSVYMTMRVFTAEGIGVRRILSLFYVPFIIGSTTFGAAYAVSQAPVFQNALLAQIAVTTLLGGSAYVLAVRRFAPRMYEDVRVKLWKLLRSSPFFS